LFGLSTASVGDAVLLKKTSFLNNNFTDISDAEQGPITTPPPTSNPELDTRQQALNYSTLAAAAAAAVSVPNGQDPSLSSTETLLRNIQGLLKVAADNARQQERQINYEKSKSKFLAVLCLFLLAHSKPRARVMFPHEKSWKRTKRLNKMNEIRYRLPPPCG